MHAKLRQSRTAYNNNVGETTEQLQTVSQHQSTTTEAEVEDTQLGQWVPQEPSVSTSPVSSDVENMLVTAKIQDESTPGGTSSSEQNAKGAAANTLSGCSLDEVILLEIFPGTGRLTRAIRDLDMSAMAVDKDKSRAQSVHVACYDLNDPDQLQALCDFIERHHSKILWAHFAPSCGTASRARGRPLPKLEKIGTESP